jgi:branched-chain amino acid transport system permease protein
MHRKEIGYWLLGILVVFLLLAGLSRVLNAYYLRIVSLIGINIILVVSLNITNGFTGIFSLGHAGFMAVGAYVSALLTLPLAKKASVLPNLPEFLAHTSFPFLPALLIGGIMTAILAFLIGFPVLRLRGHYLAVATLGFMVIVRVLADNLKDFTRGPLGLNGLPPYTTLWWVYGWVMATVYVSWRLRNSSYGRALLAIREDDLAAEVMGIPLARYKIFALCLGSFFAAIGGSLWGHLITAITPISFSYQMTFDIVVMLVIGGMGSITGSIIGAVVMTLIPQFLIPFETGLTVFGIQLPQMYGLSNITMAFLLILVMIFRPQGLMGKKEFSFALLFNTSNSEKIERG